MTPVFTPEPLAASHDRKPCQEEHLLTAARVDPPPSARALSHQLPFISVIVPARNEARFIRRTLEQLLSQRYEADRFEILVADGSSTDATPALVEELQVEHSNLRLLHNPGRLSSAGRNVGVRCARGDIVVIVDGHCEIDNPDYLHDLADAFKRSGADCVGRPQPLDVTNASPLQRAIAAARASRLGHHPASFIYSDREQFVPSKSVAVAYRAEVFDRIGLFDETFDACEDVEFNHRIDRAGLRCFFTPRARVRYYPRATLLGLFHQLRRYGQGRVRLLAKHPDTFTVPCFLPGLFVFGLVLGPLLSLWMPALAPIYAIVLSLYAAVVLATSARIALLARDRRMLAWLPLTFPMIHMGAGAGILQESLRQLSSMAGGRGRNAKHRDVLPLRENARELVSHRAPYLAVPVRLDSYRLQNITVVTSPAPPQGQGRLPRPRPRVLNALTVDVEDYFHVSAFEKIISRSEWDSFPSRVVASTHRILETLEAASVRGTFFVLGHVADRHPELVRDIQSAGHEIACHGYWHRLIYTQTPEEFRADLRHARDLLQEITGAPIVAYRAPSFSITRRNLWALDILIEEGFRYDSSIYPTYHDRYGIAGAPPQPHQIVRPAGSLWEFPMAIYRKLGYPWPIGGGGYFRLYPYSVTRHGLAKINAQGRPFVVYIHPWELDPDQPRMPAGRMTRFRHYVNLHRTQSRLERLTRDFALGTLTDVYSPLQAEGAMPRWDLTLAA